MRETYVPLAVAALVLVSAWSSRERPAPPQEQGAPQVPTDPPASLEERVAWIVDRAREDRSFEALSGAVTFRGREVLALGRGEFDGAPVDAGTPLPIGTGAELLLAVAVVHAAEAGDIELDTPLAELLPERELPWDDVTLHTLLSHTSGLADVEPPQSAAVEASAPIVQPDGEDDVEIEGGRFAVIGAQDDEQEDTADEDADEPPEWLDDVRGVAVAAEPGERFDWSSTNLLLAHLWLEDTTGQDLESYVREHLLPRSESPQAPEAEAPDGDLAPAEWARARLDLGRLVREDGWWPPSLRAAGLTLSAREWLEVLRSIESGAFAGEAHTRALLGVDADDESQDGTARGYGLHSTLLEDHAGRAHGGTVADTAVRVASYPEAELVIALVARGGADSLASLERAIARVVLDLPQPGHADLPLTRDELAHYQGVYRIGSTRLVLAVRDDRLELRTHAGTHALAFQGGNRFAALDGSDLTLAFELDASGRATQFELRRDGVDMIATRFE